MERAARGGWRFGICREDVKRETKSSDGRGEIIGIIFWG
jgi:hypothetical protein